MADLTLIAKFPGVEELKPFLLNYRPQLFGGRQIRIPVDRLGSNLRCNSPQRHPRRISRSRESTSERPVVC
jgi:hypothetical protein